jgi:glycosyltransferase involved in cell wall biosynthesis
LASISVVIITKNEEVRIRACLETVCWADEIVVVDAYSIDQTVAICHEYTDRVYQRDWPGYAVQKNWGLEQATGDWVLSLDADEEVTPGLQAEIQTILVVESPYVGYLIPRRNYLGSHWMRYAGQYPDYQLRLFRRDRGRFVGTIHERVQVDGPVGRLRGDIIHYTYRDLSDYWLRMERYASLEAQAQFQAGKRVRFTAPLRALTLAAWLYTVCGGWRGGFLGLINSLFPAFYQFLIAAKLWELRSENRSRHLPL